MFAEKPRHNGIVLGEKSASAMFVWSVSACKIISFFNIKNKNFVDFIIGQALLFVEIIEHIVGILRFFRAVVFVIPADSYINGQFCFCNAFIFSVPLRADLQICREQIRSLADCLRRSFTAT